MTLALLGGCQQPAATLLEHRMIWDRDAHNAFTDLCRWRGEWWCCFREANAHKNCIGSIHMLRSKDGITWVNKALLSIPGIDLRDPKLSVTPDDELMLIAGSRSRVFILNNPAGGFYGGCEVVGKEWLWRVTWIDGVGYGFSYAADGDPLTLWKTTGGIRYEKVADVTIPGRPTEATICPDINNATRARFIVRRETGDRATHLGTIDLTKKTIDGLYTIGPHVGGPNMIELPDGRVLVSGRISMSTSDALGGVGIDNRMVLAELRDLRLYHLLTLPSGGDCGYAGMVYHDGLLWMSYYSSHEGKAKIYLAKVKL